MSVKVTIHDFDQGTFQIAINGYEYCRVDELDEEEILALDDPTQYIPATERAQNICDALDLWITGQAALNA